MYVDDGGKSLRMNILDRDFNGDVSPLLKSHQWGYEIEKREEDGEYLLVKLEKYSIIKRVALIYTQGTKQEVFSRIEREADACLINGSFDKDSPFTKNFKKPIMARCHFLALLKDWNHEVSEMSTTEIVTDTPDESKAISEIARLVAETPSEQAWMIIKMLRSVEICKKFISKKFTDRDDVYIEEKSKGVSFLIQNACDYFDAASNQNFTQRLLSLYYGVLSFVEAEILSSSDKYDSLRMVENITQNGHGLYTVLPDVDYSLDDLYIGILGKGKGIFPALLETRGYDIESFPIKKAKSKETLNDYCFVLDDLLNRIPELSSLMKIVSTKYKTGFFTPIYDHDLNHMGGSFLSSSDCYETNNTGTYIKLYDYSRSSNIEMVKALIGPLEQHSKCVSQEDCKVYTAFVKHNSGNKDDYWWQHLNIHKSTFCGSSLLVPLKGLHDEWDIYAIMILYTLSIMVRYYPNLWRRVQYGEWDKYYAVFQQFAMVVEKVLPGIFYEKISGQKLYVSQPGAIL